MVRADGADLKARRPRRLCMPDQVARRKCMPLVHAINEAWAAAARPIRLIDPVEARSG